MMNYKYVVTLIVIAVVISVGIGYVATYKPEENGGEENEAEYVIYWIFPVGADDPAWAPRIKGAEIAGELLPIDFHLVMPAEDWTPAVYADLVSTVIALSPDAMIITPHVYTSLIDPVNAAMDKGILVWYANVHDALHESDLPDLDFVGIDDLGEGRMVAQELIKRTGLSTGDTVLICNHMPGISFSTLRVKGIHEIYDPENIAVLELDTGTDISAGAEIIKAYLTVHPEIDTSISLGALSCEEWNLAITDLGVTDVPSASFDVTPIHSTMINAGTLMFTLDCSPFNEGFLPVVFSYYRLKYKMIFPHVVDVTTKFVDKSNLAEVESLIEMGYR